jgi:hypothetical protein
VITTVLGATAVVCTAAAGGRPERLDQAFIDLNQAYPVACRTEDTPVVALLGPGLAQVAAELGRFGDAAEILGAATRLRGGDGGGDFLAVRLTDRLRAELGEQFDRRYRAGRELAS